MDQLPQTFHPAVRAWFARRFDRATDAHLQILSELAQMFSDKAFREQLLAAAGAPQLHELINNWQPHAAGQHSPAV